MNQSDLMSSVGWNGVLAIFIVLGCILVAWIVLQEVNFDKITRNPRSPKARVLQLLIAIVLGHALSRFILDYWSWTGAVKWLFGQG